MSLLVFKIVTNVTRSAQIGGKWLWFDLYQDVSVCRAWLFLFFFFIACFLSRRLLPPRSATRQNRSPSVHVSNHNLLHLFFFVERDFFFLLSVRREFVFYPFVLGQISVSTENRKSAFTFSAAQNPVWLSTQPPSAPAGAHGRCFVHFYLKKKKKPSQLKVLPRRRRCAFDWHVSFLTWNEAFHRRFGWLVVSDGEILINIILEYQ